MGGRAVLVTGGASGIGRAVVAGFAANGDRVAVHYNTGREKAEKTLAGLAGSGHVLAPADLTDPEQVRAMVDGAAEALGGLDVLVNNAAVNPLHPLTETSYESWQEVWQQVMATNLHGPANAIWCAVPHMIAAGGGRIVNVSSRGAFRGEPNQPAYGASKAGLNSLGQSLALALAPHRISVATVAPGHTTTERIQALLAQPNGSGLLDQYPLGRLGEPEEVARAVLFLASPEAEFCTGAILDVNGGSYLRS